MNKTTEKCVQARYARTIRKEIIFLVKSDTVWPIGCPKKYQKRTENKAKVKGINFIKKHEKTTKEKKGGIITKENFIHISNLRILDADDKKTKTLGKK